MVRTGASSAKASSARAVQRQSRPAPEWLVPQGVEPEWWQRRIIGLINRTRNQMAL